MAPILAPILGVHFSRGHISLKNGTFCPLLATIQALSRAHAFLLGLPDTVARTDLLYNCPKQVVCQLGIDSGLCKS
jgi:hypothetical protein